MATKTTIPLSVRRAASKFHAKRAEYYSHLASVLLSSRGATKMLTLFERDAQRYEGKPRGVLGAYWMEIYSNNGSNLADTWEGTLPDDEVSIIRVAQGAGPGALEAALADVARIAALSDKVKSEVLGTLMAAIIGLSIGIVMTTLFPVFASHKLQEIYSFIPIDQWGPKGKALNAHADRVMSYGVYVVALLAGLFAAVQWSVNNWTGPRRNWADSHIVLYRVVRDIKGALFLATMSTLTRKRGNISFTLRESLSVFAQSIRSPWLRWRVDEIVEGVDQTGAVNSDSFSTNLLSDEMFFYLRDTQEALGFADGFQETGKYVEGALVTQLVKRMAVYRWVLLLIGISSVIGIMAWQFSVIYEMKGVMQLYYSTK
jgi:type II secretory pathway component PulF